VREGHAPRFGALSRNGEGEVAGGIVMMLKGENSARVIENVKKRIEELKKSLPEGIVLKAYLDRSDLVGRAMKTVSTNLIEGGLIVIFVLVLFLGNLRAGLIVASVIPLSMLFAIGMMHLTGVSANLMSLGAIDFGLIVDGSIIVVEAILFHLHSNIHRKLSGEEMDEAVYHASSGIRKSAAFGEIIILIVYIPILALEGIEGKMFGPMAQTVSYAIAGALMLSLTYVPMMSSLFLKYSVSQKRNFSDRIVAKLYEWYEPFLLRSLKNKAKVILISIVIFVIALTIFSRMGGVFIPTLEEGDFAIETRLAPGTSLSQTISTSRKAEKILLSFPEVKEVVSKIGTAEIPTDPMPLEANDLMVILKDKSEWTTAKTREGLAEKMKEALDVLPEANFEFLQPIQMRFNELMTGVKSDIAIKIFGEDLQILSEKANQAAALIEKIEGVGDIKVEQTQGMPQISVNYDRSKIAQYGLSVNDLNGILKAAFAGEKAGEVVEGQKIFDLVLRLEKEKRTGIEDVRNLYVSLPNGEKIPLREVAEIELREAPVQISREMTRRRITIGVNVRNRDVESVVRDISRLLEKEVKLPSGYYFTYGGQFENLQKAKERLVYVVPFALALIFILLYFTFRSLKQSLLIFTAIPLASIGGITFLFLRGMPFSISAAVGFIALFGVAVLNGIVLISYFNKLRKGNMSSEEIIMKGTHERFRPVILTAAVASLGFLPMALSNSAGAEVQKPLATVVIGGLISATLLTLIVLPVLYSMYLKSLEKKEIL
jgi:cobalt-zinc-cadmium resistance protein CzcA